jgi:hypothetical protein
MCYTNHFRTKHLKEIAYLTTLNRDLKLKLQSQVKHSRKNQIIPDQEEAHAQEIAMRDQHITDLTAR